MLHCACLQAMRSVQCELHTAKLQNQQLKLEVLRWRKQNSLLRLKLASAKEKAQLHEANLDLVSAREHRLSKEAAILKDQLASAMQQLTDMTAAKMQAQAECDRFQASS